MSGKNNSGKPDRVLPLDSTLAEEAVANIGGDFATDNGRGYTGRGYANQSGKKEGNSGKHRNGWRIEVKDGGKRYGWRLTVKGTTKRPYKKGGKFEQLSQERQEEYHRNRLTKSRSVSRNLTGLR